jgi:hypothetical protein
MAKSALTGLLRHDVPRKDGGSHCEACKAEAIQFKTTQRIT